MTSKSVSAIRSHGFKSRSSLFRSGHETEKLPAASQLTIFYNGMVNVYDNIPPEKAHAIMLLAGGCNTGPSPATAQQLPSPEIQIPVLKVETADASATKSAIAYTTSCCLSSRRFVTDFKPQPTQRLSTCADLPVARKASLARFLERRRDRVQTKISSNEIEDPCIKKHEIGWLLPETLSNSKKMCIRSISPSPARSSPCDLNRALASM